MMGWLATQRNSVALTVSLSLSCPQAATTTTPEQSRKKTELLTAPRKMRQSEQSSTVTVLAQS